MVISELSLFIVGINFANADGSNRRFELLQLRPGDPVELRPEPTNEHDPGAVAVFAPNGIQLGYLSAERCGWIGGRLAAGEDAIAVFQSLSEHTAAIRVRFGGGAPTLPPERSQAEQVEQDTDEFWADPEGPEWGA